MLYELDPIRERYDGVLHEEDAPDPQDAPMLRLPGLPPARDMAELVDILGVGKTAPAPMQQEEPLPDKCRGCSYLGFCHPGRGP